MVDIRLMGSPSRTRRRIGIYLDLEELPDVNPIYRFYTPRQMDRHRFRIVDGIYYSSMDPVRQSNSLRIRKTQER